MNVVIGIHPDRSGTESYSERWTASLEERGATVRELDLLAADALEQVQPCHGVMCRWFHNPHHKQSLQRILFAIEHHLQLPVFPNTRTSWHYDDKNSQQYVLQLLGAPMPRTWLFWRKDEALTWARSAPYPVVFKLAAGAASQNVIKVQSESEAVQWIDRAFDRGIFPMTLHRRRGLRAIARQTLDAVTRSPDALAYFLRGEHPRLNPRWWKPEFGYAYFQEFLEGNAFDTRVTVLNERAFGYRRLNRPDDFRASGSGRFIVDPEVVDKRCIEIAFEISKRGEFQSMSYDFLYRKGKPVVSEISYTFVDWMIHECPGHWDTDFHWHEGQLWPEEVQAEDFLNEVLARRTTQAASPLPRRSMHFST